MKRFRFEISCYRSVFSHYTYADLEIIENGRGSTTDTVLISEPITHRIWGSKLEIEKIKEKDIRAAKFRAIQRLRSKRSADRNFSSLDKKLNDFLK